MAAMRIAETGAGGALSLIADYRSPLAHLCRDYRVQRLELFGSAVHGAFDPQHSDLDFLVEFEPMPAGDYATLFFGFKEALETLFGLPVDLVVPSAIHNPYFRQSIERSKALLYAA